ncbi:MAG: hypothetical protein O3B77_08715 [Proteobacteria bacterium]|nr:hypothetical protein [Pseudomonadota bacterium]
MSAFYLPPAVVNIVFRLRVFVHVLAASVATYRALEGIQYGEPGQAVASAAVGMATIYGIGYAVKWLFQWLFGVSGR